MNDVDLKNFKQILLRFVAYLNFANALSKSKIEGKTIEEKFKKFYENQNLNSDIKRLYHTLCESNGKNDDIDISDIFGWSGQGYRGKGSILNLIKDICVFEDGQISISIDATSSYKSKGCYLHWLILGSDVSIYPIWKGDRNDTNNEITSLMVCLSKDKNQEPTVKNSIQINKINDKDFVKPFYDLFVSLKKESLSLLLLRAKNIIYTGAPGTGKTFLAKQIANLIGAKREFVQFHPSYDYTDFVEGLRPVKDNKSDHIVFERKDGIFKAFCERALFQYLVTNDVDEAKLQKFMQNKENQEENEYNDLKENIKTKLSENQGKKEAITQDGIPPYVFIIDEINRGEISKIFGELFFSVDPGYRGVEGKVKTQYANLQEESNLFDLVLQSLGEIEKNDKGYFFIPENVYIIGTMNDIDRSVESLDFAFRRRFTFKEITAKDTQLQILNDVCADNEERDTLVETMNNLNEAISAYEEFSDAYHIGGAYFRHYKDYVGQDNQMDKLWDNHIKGVLIEYLRGRPDCDKRLKELKSNYDKGLFGRIGITEQQLRGYLSKKCKDKSEEIIEEIKGVLREIEQEKNEILQYKVSLMNDKTIAKVIEEAKVFIKQTKAKKTEQLNDGVDNINAK